MSVDPVDWDLARRIASRVGGRDPYAAAYHREGLEADFEEFTPTAEELVAECTGLRSLAGDARGRVTDRAGWVDANLSAFQRLLRPITDKLGEKLDGPTAPLARRLAGAELGMMLGWMSTRVLGQYDLLVIEDEDPDDQDIVYYVAPNVLSLEKRYAFPPREFRLWLALHEVTHRAQFTGIPWMREHFLGLVKSVIESVEPDPRRFMAGLQRMLEARRRGEDPLADGGLMAVFASEAQRDVINQVAGLMSLLEGHGDVTMDRAGRGLVPSAERFGRVLRQRRQSSRGLARVLQRVVGLDAKIKQYAQGERFIEMVESAGGTALLDRAWVSPDKLPSIDEIRSPELWIARVGAPELAA
ncbi:MAG: zinc-dependent metalloprotease [Acidimicrobiales bacterium]